MSCCMWRNTFWWQVHASIQSYVCVGDSMLQACCLHSPADRQQGFCMLSKLSTNLAGTLPTMCCLFLCTSTMQSKVESMPRLHCLGQGTLRRCCMHSSTVGWQKYKKGRKLQCSAHLAGWCKLPVRRMSQTVSGHHPAGTGNAIPVLLPLTDQMLLCNITNIVRGKQVHNDPVR